MYLKKRLKIVVILKYYHNDINTIFDRHVNMFKTSM